MTDQPVTSDLQMVNLTLAVENAETAQDKDFATANLQIAATDWVPGALVRHQRIREFCGSQIEYQQREEPDAPAMVAAADVLQILNGGES